MKITIERTTLLRALSHVQSVVERRNTIPILSNVLMRADGGSVAFTATDLDIEIVERVPADVIAPGAITASAVTLHDIAKKLPDGAQVHLTLERGSQTRLRLAAGNASFALTALPEEDFPTLAAFNTDGAVTFSLPAADLRQLIDKTRFAMSQEETRYYLNGIYLHAVKDPAPALRAVATDGHRLARVDVDLPAGAADMAGVIVPRKAVIELRRLLDDADSQVELTVAANSVRLRFGDIVLTTKLIDGTFPDYARVIPVNNDRVLRVDNQDFARAVDRVSTVSAEKTRSVKLAAADDQLTLMVNSPDTGTATEQLSVDYSAPALEIGFNARYLIDIADQISGDTALYRFNDSGSPMVVTDASDPRALFVLMPLRV